MRENKKLVLIIPCYNEEEIIEQTAENLTNKLNSLISADLISGGSQICFVNDGSTDKTYELLKNFAEKNDKIALINLTRNFGQQYAMLAGIKTVNADIVITLDADLQDNIDSIDDMIKKYHEGFEIVYGCRNKRESDTFWKKTTAIAFYKIIKFLCPRLQYNHAEYRLLGKKAIELLKDYKEKQIFLRGMIPQLGLNSSTVYYDRAPRNGGQTKYNYIKLFELAWEGITNYSNLPLRIISLTGLILIIFSLFDLMFREQESTALILSTMYFLSGIIVLSAGILGEYIAKILYEVKDRPLYQIESTKNL